jgi:hypothetical protein
MLASRKKSVPVLKLLPTKSMVNLTNLNQVSLPPTNQALVLNCHLSAISLLRVVRFLANILDSKVVWSTRKAMVKWVNMVNTLLHTLHTISKDRSTSSVSRISGVVDVQTSANIGFR